jgi:hypothetical protein
MNYTRGAITMRQISYEKYNEYKEITFETDDKYEMEIIIDKALDDYIHRIIDLNSTETFERLHIKLEDWMANAWITYRERYEDYTVVWGSTKIKRKVEEFSVHLHESPIKYTTKKHEEIYILIDNTVLKLAEIGIFNEVTKQTDYGYGIFYIKDLYKLSKQTYNKITLLGSNINLTEEEIIALTKLKTTKEFK